MASESWTPRIFNAVALAALAVFAVRLAALWAGRWSYPYDLEWMEGGMLVHAWRLLHGRPLYPEPGPDFIPFVYPPGQASLLAFLANLFPLGAPLGRATSIVASLGAAGSLVYALRRVSGRWVPGWFAAGLFLTGYRFSGAFYDLVRIDALSICLLGGSIALALDGRRGTRLASGLMLVAAFLVKHHAVLFGVPLLILIYRRDGWRPAWRFALAAAVPALVLTAYLQWVTGGRFLSYLLDVPAAHGAVYERGFPGSVVELWEAYPLVSVVVGAAMILAAVRRDAARSEQGGGIFGIALTAMCVSAVMRAHQGGFVNVLIPAYWALCLGFGWLAAQWRSVVGSALVAFVVVGQVGWAMYRFDAEKLTPTITDRRTGDTVVELLRSAETPVLSPFAPWLPVLAGHEPAFHLIALWDIEHHRRSPYPDLGRRIRHAVRYRHWATVVDGKQSMEYGVKEAYRVGPRLPIRAGAFRPRTGWPAPLGGLRVGPTNGEGGD